MFEIHTRPESTVVCPRGDLDLSASLRLRHIIGDLLEPGISIVIDLRHVGRTEPEGLSALVGSVRRVRAAGGSAYVTEANPHLQWLLLVAGVDGLLAPTGGTSSYPAA